jgi:hypothetical protein
MAYNLKAGHYGNDSESKAMDTKSPIALFVGK